MFKKIITFVTEVKLELGKVSWPNRQELIGATAAVMLITAILGIYIGIADLSLSKLLTFLVR